MNPRTELSANHPSRPSGPRPRLLMWLTIIHTVPVLWLTPVVGGTAPIAALLAFGVASLFSFDRGGIALGFMVGIPGLIYAAIAWLVVWLVDKLLRRVRRATMLAAVFTLCVVPLVLAYFPIYVAGGHSSTSQSDIFGFFDGYVSTEAFLTYWIALHVVLLLLFAYLFVKPASFVYNIVLRVAKPAVVTFTALGIGVIVYNNFTVVICRPLAELGSNVAQVCVARAGGPQQRYWYERAGRDGDAQALAWLVENTRNRSRRLEWARIGAEQGNPAAQFAMYEHLQSDAAMQVQAREWLRKAAEGDLAPAQIAWSEVLVADVYRSGSQADLVASNAWLERAVAQGSRFATVRLAQHLTRGSMGFPIDQRRARSLYLQLLQTGPVTQHERMWKMNEAAYQAQIKALDRWTAGLAANDPQVLRELADLYLRSQYPGPGVRERGRTLLEQVAASDQDARDDLIVGLRTGSGGLSKDVDAARDWLLEAAHSGGLEAMHRVVRNYMDGREGFAVDYPKARHWLGLLEGAYQTSSDADASRRLAQVRRDLKYIDRLDGIAGAPLLGPTQLTALSQRNDADSHYRFALQLLAGHDAARRAEAIDRLRKASDLGHGNASWRLVEIYERGFPDEINATSARRELQRAVAQHHFGATRELASRYEYGKKGYAQDLPTAIAMYEAALAAGRDNRYGWDLDPDNYNHFRWLESRLRQARGKLARLSAQVSAVD